jgi:hypothetical protein
MGNYQSTAHHNDQNFQEEPFETRFRLACPPVVVTPELTRTNEGQMMHCRVLRGIEIKFWKMNLLGTHGNFFFVAVGSDILVYLRDGNLKEPFTVLRFDEEDEVCTHFI